MALLMTTTALSTLTPALGTSTSYNHTTGADSIAAAKIQSWLTIMSGPSILQYLTRSQSIWSILWLMEPVGGSAITLWVTEKYGGYVFRIKNTKPQRSKSINHVVRCFPLEQPRSIEVLVFLFKLVINKGTNHTRIYKCKLSDHAYFKLALVPCSDAPLVYTSRLLLKKILDLFNIRCDQKGHNWTTQLLYCTISIQAF